MKNHIVFKTIAIILCAAALLGAIGCGAGVAVLTGLGLYEKNPTQLYEEWVNDRGMWLAHDVAARYASKELGGCPEDLLSRYYYPTNGGFQYGYFGYELKDAEGNVLDLLEVPGTDAEHRTYPVTGKYMHVVSAEPVSISEPVDSVEPDILCDGIHLAGNGIQMTQEGQIHHLIVTNVPPISDESFTTINLVPNNTTEEVTFASGDETVATVDENGLITAVGNGITVIHITCGELSVDFPVSCQIPEAVQETAPPETVPATEATLPPFQYDAWEDDKWEEIKDWIQEEWSKDSWDPDKQHELTDWIKKNWAEDEWTDDQWEQLNHWIEEEWNPKEPVEAVEPTVPETTVPETVPPTEPVIDLKALEEESRQKEAELETVPEEITVNGRPITDYEVNVGEYWDHQSGASMQAKYVMLDMPEYTLELYLAPGAFAEDMLMPVLELLWVSRQMMLPMLFVFLLLFALLGVYLCCTAGRKPKSDEVRASGLNRMPLELYLGLTIGAAALAIMYTCYGSIELIRMNLVVGCASVVGIAYLACLIVVGFLYALVAQLKTPDRFWLKNSLCGHCWRVCLWLLNQLTRLFPFFFRCAKRLWDFTRRILSSLLRWIGNTAKYIGGKFGRIYAMLPLIWQWLLAGASLFLMPLFALVIESEFLLAVAFLADIALVIYGALAFGTLLDATKRMAQGDLNTPIDDKLLFGCFKDFADNLKALAKVAMVAAQKQLKSERMKTELITNVSHDIKTPLTSIVSYVDLLQKPHTPEEEKQYLEVLSRQSLSLKKLIEDLIEMSKASTGNMTVDIQQVDAVESVNQALGEFADKLDKAMLTPMFRHSTPSVPMMADGKLTWRVLHNLLSNAVKYALPGTRLYIDLMEVEGKVILSMKNVSRDELNVDAEELMERFVRGDDSRNTEGSGLGLNIAKSMMELQKGELQLLVDGDLFKVTLIFPAN